MGFFETFESRRRRASEFVGTLEEQAGCVFYWSDQ
jgi:hypothetical protein